MPHQIIEYSKNLDAEFDIDELIRALHDAAASLDFLPTGGIRTRAAGREHFRIADGHADNAFIHVTLRIASGRTDEQKQMAGEHLFGALGDFVANAFERRPLALSLEIQDLDPGFRWKRNNIRGYMEERGS